MKLHLLQISIFAAVSAAIPLRIASADIYNCNGKWQNKPCEDGDASQTIEEHPKGSNLGQPTIPILDDPKVKPVVPSVSPGTNTVDVKREDKGSKCPQGQTFTTTRPKPTMDFQYYPENAGKASGKLKVAGTLKGNGQVKVVLTLSQPGRGDERQAWSKNFSLPEQGGEEEFSKTVDLPVGASFLLTANNSGSFRGYCAGPGGGEKKED